MRVALALTAAALFTVAFASAGCSAGNGAPDVSQDPDLLQGREWRLTGAETADETGLVEAGITVTFDGSNMGGFSGVNQYGAGYVAGEDGSLELDEIAGTLMAGPEDAMAAEQEYLELLGRCDGYLLSGATLTLLSAGSPVLDYEGSDQVGLGDAEWTVTSYNNGKQAVVTVAEGSEVTLAFGPDGRVSGLASVNTYNGPYEFSASSVKIGPLATTKMAGPPELMEQEAAYLAALQAATTWTTRGEKLELRDDEGALQVQGVARD